MVSLEKLIQRNVISDSLIIENEYWVAKKLNKVDPYYRAMDANHYHEAMLESRAMRYFLSRQLS